ARCFLRLGRIGLFFVRCARCWRRLSHNDAAEHGVTQQGQQSNDRQRLSTERSAHENAPGCAKVETQSEPCAHPVRKRLNQTSERTIRAFRVAPENRRS